MLTTPWRQIRRSLGARELVCPDCSGAVVLLRGRYHCTGPNHIAEMRGTQAWESLADLVVGDRLVPDCRLAALASWNRRTARECREWFARGRLN